MLVPLLKSFKKDDIVIYGQLFFQEQRNLLCTNLKYSNLKFNSDFFCGYSPERINLEIKKSTYKYKKITSGSNKEVADFIDKYIKDYQRVPHQIW